MCKTHPKTRIYQNKITFGFNLLQSMFAGLDQAGLKLHVLLLLGTISDMKISTR